MKDLEKNIGYTFKNKEILNHALTHCSYGAEHNVKHNQRLEFLGDAVLENVISNYIYNNFPDYDEGKLSRLRASIVSEDPLSSAAEKIELSNFVLLGAGEKATGGANKPSVLSDTLEAVFAAVYLDGGFFEAEKVILKVMDEILKNPSERALDFKTTLQEYLFRNGPVDVDYNLVSMKGPSHNAVFTVEVYCNNKFLGRGTGSSKKRAEQAAAKEALNKIKK
ncbi:MAG: ribonuclease III [Clostridiales bacterium]|nr:ribonuclease III [Clostridiales bacterium]